MMPVTLLPLSRNDRKFYEEFCMGIYLKDSSCEFAAALHLGLGLLYPMVALMNEGQMRHVGIREVDGMFRDARGVASLEEFGKPFGLKPPYDLRNVSLEDLRTERIVLDENIERALGMAQMLWPDLQWMQGPLCKARSFVLELEKLSRKHGGWVHSLGTSLPILSLTEDGEEGYALGSALHGSSYCFNRRFAKNEE